MILKIVNGLAKKKLTVSFAESCTGGWISKLVTDVPGASTVFKGSCVAYWNNIKVDVLGVKSKTLEKYGAVSKHTAREMAEGVRKKYKTNIGISVTGIAGPGGGTPRKPVGLVFVALSKGKTCKSWKFNFKGNRMQVRKQATEKVLKILRENI